MRTAEKNLKAMYSSPDRCVAVFMRLLQRISTMDLILRVARPKACDVSKDGDRRGPCRLPSFETRR